MFQLTTPHRPDSRAPTSDNIRGVLCDLIGEEDPYVVLDSPRRDHFMQAWWTPTGFLLEYQDGGVANHFQTTRHDLTVEEIAGALEGYVSGDESAWRTRSTFERIDPRPPAYLVGIRVGRFVRAW